MWSVGGFNLLDLHIPVTQAYCVSIGRSWLANQHRPLWSSRCNLLGNAPLSSIKFAQPMCSAIRNCRVWHSPKSVSDKQANKTDQLINQSEFVRLTGLFSEHRIAQATIDKLMIRQKFWSTEFEANAKSICGKSKWLPLGS